MTPNTMVLISHLIISAINIAEGTNQYRTITEYIKEAATTNQQRSLILVYNNTSLFEEFSASFYNLDLPLYNIYLPELRRFNGKYNDKYDISVTFEESKLYFMFIGNIGDLYNDLPLVRKIYFWRDRDRTVVFVNQTYDHTVLTPSFLLCFQYYIINIVFVFLGDEIISFTYNPFSGEYLLPVKSPRNLFPDKFKDLYGYRLKISMFPEVINEFEEGTFQGSDGLMSRAIANQINATYIYIPPKINDLANILNQYDDVADRLVDVGFNTRYVKFNFKNLIEKTYPHDRDDLACLIPKTGMKAMTALTSLLPGFVWFFTLGASLFFFAYILASAVVGGQQLDLIKVLMMILLLILNKPIKELKMFNFRLALLSFLFLCSFLNNLLICRLTSIFAAPDYYDEIDTVTELADTNYEIITIDRFQELLDASLSLSIKEKIFRRLTIIDEKQYLNEIRKCKNVVFICKYHLANYANIQKENYPNGIQFYRIMKENILPTLSCYIVRYGSPFLMRFDVLVRRIVESGMYDYWKKKTWHKLGMDNYFRFQHTNYGDGKGVSIHNMWTGILFLLIGLATSFVVFLFELCLSIR